MERAGNISSGHAANAEHDAEPIPIMMPTIMPTMTTTVMGMVILMLMIGIVMVLMPIVARILPSRFLAGSAVTNGSPRGSPRKLSRIHHVTAGSANATMQPDENTVVAIYR
jgi:hypothetical protein